MTEVIPVVETTEAAEPLTFFGWLVMFWTDVIFNFEFEKDWPTISVFFATLCVALVVFYEIGKSLGLVGGPEFLGLTKMLPGSKKGVPFTVELRVDSDALRAIDVSSKKELWKVSFFSIVSWGHSEHLFQVILMDHRKREQTVSFATTQGKAISSALGKKIAFLQDNIDNYIAKNSHKVIASPRTPKGSEISDAKNDLKKEVAAPAGGKANAKSQKPLPQPEKGPVLPKGQSSAAPAKSQVPPLKSQGGGNPNASKGQANPNASKGQANPKKKK